MQNNNSRKDEIDLIDLFLAFRGEQKIFFFSIVFFLVLGVIIALTSKEEYISQVLLLPEGRQQTAGISLAQQFGLNLQPSTSDGLSTELYPDIVQSYPFLLPILDEKIYYSQINDSLSILNYFNNYYSEVSLFSAIISGVKKYTIGLPRIVSGWFKQNESSGQYKITELSSSTDTLRNSQETVIDINNYERRAINLLRSRITVSNNGNVIAVRVKMPEPGMTTNIIDDVTNSLINYIKNYRTEKARSDVGFIEERYDEARVRFEQSQVRLASFRDQNRGNLTQVALTQEQRLQSDYDLAFNIYNTLARRYEEARLKLQEETPVVRVLEPAITPTSPSEPNRTLIILIYLFLGVFTGFVLVYVKLAWIKIHAAIKINKISR